MFTYAKKLFESFRRRIISTAPPGARPLVAASVTSSASVHSFQGLCSMRRTIRQCRAGGNTPPKKGSVTLVDNDFRPRKNLFLQAHREVPQEIVLDLDSRTIFGGELATGQRRSGTFYRAPYRSLHHNCRGSEEMEASSQPCGMPEKAPLQVQDVFRVSASSYIHFEIMNVNCRGPTMLATGIR